MSGLLVWFDTETTGTTPKYHEIVEFASIITDMEANRIGELHLFARPDYFDNIDPEALEVNNMTIKNLEAFENSQKDLYEKIEAYFKNILSEEKNIKLCGHNIEFDISMVNGLYELQGEVSFDTSRFSGTLDTWDLHNELQEQGIVPKTRVQKLEKVCNEYFYTDPDKVNYHSGIDDISQNVRLYDFFRRKTARHIMKQTQEQTSMFD